MIDILYRLIGKHHYKVPCKNEINETICQWMTHSTETNKDNLFVLTDNGRCGRTIVFCSECRRKIKNDEWRMIRIVNCSLEVECADCSRDRKR